MSAELTPYRTQLMRACLIRLLCIFPLALPTLCHSEPEVLGWLEGGYLQPWGVRVRAKLDTGALTSSIDAKDVQVFERNGIEWVRFHFPYGLKEGYENGFDIERPLVRKAVVKERDGNNAARYVVSLDICVSGNTFPAEFSLADRANFNYPMILGRRALSGRFIVDPDKTFSGNRSCPRHLAKPKRKKKDH